MALKLRRVAFTFTNRWPPQKDGAASFRRLLGGSERHLLCENDMYPDPARVRGNTTGRKLSRLYTDLLERPLDRIIEEQITDARDVGTITINAKCHGGIGAEPANWSFHDTPTVQPMGRMIERVFRFGAEDHLARWLRGWQDPDGHSGIVWKNIGVESEARPHKGRRQK